MCFPAAGAALGVAQALTSFVAQTQDFKAKSAAWKENYVNALAAGRDEQKQITNRQLQESDALTQKEHLANVEEAEARSEATVSAAYGGVSGASVDNLLMDISRRSAMNRHAERENWKATAAQLQAEADGTVARMKDRIASVPRPTPPNPLALAINVGGALLRGAPDDTNS